MSEPTLGFFARLQLALAFLFGGPSLPAAKALPPPPPPETPKAPTPKSPLEVHASALFVLQMLQREGRLIDFLQEDVASFSDAEVGAAARVVHDGCARLLSQYLTLAPVLTASEGATVTVPAGFDPNRYRLAGNVAGAAPYSGALKHHGWVATAITLPALPTSVDLAVLSPAEVELL
jgi:hypothetical protein